MATLKTYLAYLLFIVDKEVVDMGDKSPKNTEKMKKRTEKHAHKNTPQAEPEKQSK
jgi:hypothetical protein